jgi:hypothetical protein
MNDAAMMLRIALQVVLDQIDYTQGACTPTEMVGACLPREVLEMAHEVLENTKEQS